MVIRGLILVALLATVVGCAKDAPNVVPAGAIETKVPVPVCSAGIEDAIARSKAVDRPLVLPIKQLTEADRDNYDKVQKAYVGTIALLVEYIGKLEADRDEIDLQCKASKDLIKTLNTVQPNIPSPTQ